MQVHFHIHFSSISLCLLLSLSQSLSQFVSFFLPALHGWVRLSLIWQQRGAFVAHRKSWERDSDLEERKKQTKLRVYVLESVMMCSGAASGWTEARSSHYERPCCLGLVYMTHDNISQILLFLFHLQVIKEIDDDVRRLLNMPIIMRTAFY